MHNSNIIHCIVVDDEPPALAVLEKYISAIPSLSLVATCNNAVEALPVLQNEKIDLLFIDIQMPNILGTDFIRTLINPPKIIFTTAYRKYAVDGFELDAVDYLLKPISFERFLKAVNKVMRLNLHSADTSLPHSEIAQAATPGTFIFLRAERKNIRVHLDDILFIESLKDYLKVVTKEKTVITKQSISSLEEMLPSSAFIRTHRSFIIATGKIDAISSDQVQIGKYEIPVSRSYRHEVEKMLKPAELPHSTGTK